MELPREKLESLILPLHAQATIVSCRALKRKIKRRDFAVRLQNPTEEILVRVYPDALSSHAIEKEMHMLRVVMPETGVPTPHVRHFDDSRTVIEWPYALLTFLPGESLTQALPRMDDLDEESVGYELGRYLAKLHAVPLDRFGEFLGDDSFASPDEKSYVVARLTAWLASCREAALLDEEIVDEARRFVLASRALDRGKACLVHGDLGAERINVEEGVGGFHVTGFLQFSSAQGWSPEWDAAFLWEQIFERHPAMEKGFLDGYADAGGLPNGFWERLMVYRLLVDVCELLAAYRDNDQASIETHQERFYRVLTDLEEAGQGELS